MRCCSDGGPGGAYGYGNTTRRLFFNVSRSLTNRTYGTKERTNERTILIQTLMFAVVCWHILLGFSVFLWMNPQTVWSLLQSKMGPMIQISSYPFF